MTKVIEKPNKPKKYLPFTRKTHTIKEEDIQYPNYCTKMQTNTEQSDTLKIHPHAKVLCHAHP